MKAVHVDSKKKHIQIAEWENKGILIDGKRLNHLRFADDATLIANIEEKLQEMPIELNNNSQEIGLKINSAKTKYLNNETEDYSQELCIEGKRIGKVQTFLYIRDKKLKYQIII